MNFVIRLIFLTSILSILQGCYRPRSKLIYEEIKGISGSGTLIRTTTPLGFDSLHKFILKPKCLSCHSGPNAEPMNDPIDFSTYESTMVDRFIPLVVKGNPYKGRLFNSVESGEMPPKMNLHQKEIDFIKKWIEACAPKEAVTEISSECPADDDGGDDDW